MTAPLGPTFSIQTIIATVTGHAVEIDGTSLTVPCEPWGAHLVAVRLNGKLTSSRLFTTEHEARRAQRELVSFLNAQPGAIPRIGPV